MAIERVLVAIKGGKQRRKKNKGWGGEGKYIVAINGFVIATCGGDRKVFHCHMQVVIEKFLVTIIAR
jgi:hypothetical protein